MVYEYDHFTETERHGKLLKDASRWPIAAFVGSADDSNRRPLLHRGRADQAATLILIMARHGLRVSEAVDLEWDQIDFLMVLINPT